MNLTKYSYCAIIAIDQRKFTVLMKFIQLKQHPEQRLSYHAPQKKNPAHLRNVIKLTENEKEAGVCLYVSERTPAITYTKMA